MMMMRERESTYEKQITDGILASDELIWQTIFYYQPFLFYIDEVRKALERVKH